MDYVKALPTVFGFSLFALATVYFMPLLALAIGFLTVVAMLIVWCVEKRRRDAFAAQRLVDLRVDAIIRKHRGY